jgi:predicted Zn-dependent protease
MKTAVVVVVAAALTTFAPREGNACINEVTRQLTPAGEIAQAERDLEEGRAGEATHRVRLRYPDVRTLTTNVPPLALRAMRVYAMALVRANGQLDSGLGWARWGNLEWAITTLEELDAKRPNDPRSQADLAEARTRLSRTRETGIKVLEDLDRRDLLGSADAYLALARARRASGDDGGAAAAVRRCAVMSGDPKKCMSDPWT